MREIQHTRGRERGREEGREEGIERAREREQSQPPRRELSQLLAYAHGCGGAVSVVHFPHVTLSSVVFVTITPFFFKTRLRHSKCSRACATSSVPCGSIGGAQTRRRERVRSAHGGSSPAAPGLQLQLRVLGSVLSSASKLASKCQ